MSASSQGSQLLRLEDHALLRGRGRYVDDVHLDRMVHAAFVRSPHPHAKVNAIQTDKAIAAGALAVLTAKDLPFIEKRLIARYWHPSIRRALPTFLAVDRVRFVGEPVALVIGADRYRAEDYAQLVDVDYEPLDAVGTVSLAQNADAPSIHAEWPGNIAAQFQHRLGDALSARAKAPKRLSRHFAFGRQGAIPLETRGCVCDFDSSRNALTVWLATQTHYAVRLNLAELLGIPEYNVRVIAGDVGGGFGSKSRPYVEEIVVAHASRKLGRPVKWIEDRLEHMMATTQSRGILTELELAYDQSGLISSLCGRLIVDVGAYVSTSGIITAEVAASHCCGPYKIPNVQVDVICVGTNKTPLATCRGAGQPEATFPLESMFDLVAKDIGITAVEIRRRNLLHPADMPYDPSISYGGGKALFESGDFPTLLARAVSESGYGEDVQSGPFGERTAWGLACGVESTGLINYESARVKVDLGGYVVVDSGLTTQGQGQATAFREVCAETLGISPDRITVRLGDTDLLSFGRGTFASRGAVMGANAVFGAALGVRNKAMRCAAQLLQCDPAELTLRDGIVVRNDGSATNLSLQQIVQALQPGGPLFSGDMTLEETFIFDSKNAITLALSIHLAKVSVDLRTGICEVLDYFVMHDVGRMLNERIVDGQVIGGTVEGIGCTLLSEFVHDETGQLLTGSLADYLVITAPEAPRIRIGHMDSRPTTNPLGVRGVGESGTIAAPSAIVNAISRAIHPSQSGHEQELFTLPVKPEAICRAIARIV